MYYMSMAEHFFDADVSHGLQLLLPADPNRDSGLLVRGVSRETAEIVTQSSVVQLPLANIELMVGGRIVPPTDHAEPERTDPPLTPISKLQRPLF